MSYIDNCVALRDIAGLVERTGRDKSKIPVYSISKHDGFVRSDLYFKKRVHSEDVSNYKIVEPGDFAFSPIHLDEGAIALASEIGLISPMYKVFEINNKLCDSRYLIRFLKSAKMVAQYVTLGDGSVHRRRSVSFDRLSQVKIYLPPLHEQQRIAAILDKVDAIHHKRRRALELLNTLNQSILVDMFGDPTDTGGPWPRMPLVDVSKRITVGIVVKPSSYYKPTGVIAVRSLNIRKNEFDLTDVVRISPRDNESIVSKSRIFEGDIVIVRTGQPGTAAVVTEDLNGANAIDVLICSPDRDVVEPQFVCDMINSEAGRRMVLANKRGQIQQHLNAGSLKVAEFPIPPIEMQREYLEKTARQRKLIGIYKQNMTVIESSLSTFQQMAFYGRL